MLVKQSNQNLDMKIKHALLILGVTAIAFSIMLVPQGCSSAPKSKKSQSPTKANFKGIELPAKLEPQYSGFLLA